jgi:hypothetical protein
VHADFTCMKLTCRGLCHDARHSRLQEVAFTAKTVDLATIQFSLLSDLVRAASLRPRGRYHLTLWSL